MNFLNLVKFLLGSLKGSNVHETIAKVCQTAGTAVAAVDSNKGGNDDLAAGALLAIGEGFEKYSKQASNQHGNIVDSLIAGLQEYRTQAEECGLIVDKS